MNRYQLHLVSDATGETLTGLTRAALAQFEHAKETNEHRWVFVRSAEQMQRVIAGIESQPGLVLFTLVDLELRQILQDGCRRLKQPCISVLDPVIAAFVNFFGERALGEPGRQHELDQEYFGRIEAMDFTMTHDDGQHTEDLDTADIILVGISRTSKTPTAIYLANRGLKTANVAFVPGIALPPQLEAARKPLIVGLTVNADRLVQVRRNRLLSLKQTDETAYVDAEAVKAEIAAARKLFTRLGWPVIDVTRRSIEETAAAVLNLYDERKEKGG